MKTTSEQMIQGSNSLLWSIDFLLSEAFAHFIELIPEAVIISNEGGLIILANQHACSLFGYSTCEFTTTIIEQLVTEDIRPIHAKFRENFFKNPTPRYLKSRDLALHAVRKDQTTFPMESALFAIPTNTGQYAVNLIQDITERDDQHRKITEYAFIDALTQLPNRRYFDTNLEQLLAKSHRHNQTIAFLYFDLDHFKPANDQFGHHTGDHILKQISQRLNGTIRTEDFLARIGGDEFSLLIFPYTDHKTVNEIATRILKECSHPISINEDTHQLSASIGIAISNSNTQTSQQLIHEADQAMYQAKEKGGNTFCYADTETK